MLLAKAVVVIVAGDGIFIQGWRVNVVPAFDYNKQQTYTFFFSHAKHLFPNEEQDEQAGIIWEAHENFNDVHFNGINR